MIVSSPKHTHAVISMKGTEHKWSSTKILKLFPITYCGNIREMCLRTCRFVNI